MNSRQMDPQPSLIDSLGFWNILEMSVQWRAVRASTITNTMVPHSQYQNPQHTAQNYIGNL